MQVAGGDRLGIGGAKDGVIGQRKTDLYKEKWVLVRIALDGRWWCLRLVEIYPERKGGVRCTYTVESE